MFGIQSGGESEQEEMKLLFLCNWIGAPCGSSYDVFMTVQEPRSGQ